MDRKFRVVWITQVSNQEIRDHLSFDNGLIERLVRSVLRKPKAQMKDDYQWITNGLNEYKSIPDIELHLISPHIGISGVQEFQIDGIYYHFFRSEDDLSLFAKHFKKMDPDPEFRKNRQTIKKFIDKINPDIIQVIGAENPKYALSALDVDTNDRTLIVSLQTLMSAPGFKENYPLSESVYEYRTECEKKVIRHTKYIGTRTPRFRQVVWSDINPDAVFLNTTLFVGETIHREELSKQYDVIYFAKDIAKACDIALKTMQEIVRIRPDVTMTVVGGCTNEYHANFTRKIEEYGIASNINYLGVLPTHDDVIRAVRSAKVALLPVKIESITGTMREAMANGVPVVTTLTWGTPKLNEKRRSALVEIMDDYVSLAQDIVNILEDKELYKELRNNAFKTVEEMYSNKAFAITQNQVYHALIEWKEKGTVIPEALCAYNPSNA